MPRRSPRAINASEPIRDCERWSTSLQWPAPIDKRLNDLLTLAVEEGESEKLSRAELLAALVLAAPASGEELGKLLRKYRKARVGDAIVVRPGEAKGNVIRLGDRRPGPRS